MNVFYPCWDVIIYPWWTLSCLIRAIYLFLYLKCQNGSNVILILHRLTLQRFSCLMNPIKYVHPAAFRGLLVLEHLKLLHTQLHQLPSLQHIGQSLTRLVVSRSAYFKGTYEGSLSDLRKIKYVSMNHNGLRSTPLRLNLIAKTIMTLELSCNAINSVTSLASVEFIKLIRLDLRHNNITHLRPEFLIAPHLQYLNLVGNQLSSLADVTLYSWGNSLSEHKYMEIVLQQNPWHCNGSLIWIYTNLYKLGSEIIYAKPPSKPYIGDVNWLLCESPDARSGKTVVPMDVIGSVNISIRSLHDLASKCHCDFSSNGKLLLNSTIIHNFWLGRRLLASMAIHIAAVLWLIAVTHN